MGVTMFSNGLKSKPLPSQAVAELQGIADWLQSEKAEFHLDKNINICNNKDGLAKATSKFTTWFTTKVTVCQNCI